MLLLERRFRLVKGRREESEKERERENVKKITELPKLTTMQELLFFN